jgi:RimJ/RimL family protein N-acetyltransferase
MIFIKGERVILEPLDENHLGTEYKQWLNDPEINRFTSRSSYPLNLAACKDYVQSCQSAERIVLAISIEFPGQPHFKIHIGNISLQKINLINRTAELAILIGERQGEGYGLEAAKLVCAHGFNQLGLNRIYCGTHAENIGMQKLALKLGMQEEGRSRKALFKNGEFADVIHYGMLQEDFINADLGIHQSQPLSDHP